MVVAGDQEERGAPSSWGYNAEGWRQKAWRSTFSLGYSVQGQSLQMSFYHLERRKGKELGKRERGEKPPDLHRNSALSLGKQELYQEAWYDKGDVVC